MAGTSRKRKLDDAQKYYAVKAGHTTGVFGTWNECQQNTTGYKGAVYKSFTSEQDAKDFVAGKIVKVTSEDPKFYGVAVGRVPGVYEDWPTAQAQIKDVKGPKYKKFTTRAEAQAFVRGEKAAEPAAKKARTSADSSTSFATTSKAGSSGTSSAPEIRVYTDGSSLGNGKVGSRAGVGVFFGVDDERNVSEPLEGGPQTNQRAELAAVLRALQIIHNNEDVCIVTDSNYSINCCTVWYQKWEKNDWKSANGKDVMNQDLIMPIREIISTRDGKGATTRLQWVKGHSDDPYDDDVRGNNAADLLAVAGARMH